MENKIEQGYEFDDVLIVPQYSRIVSRSDVDMSQEIILNNGDILKMDIPIIASPMKEITGVNLVKEIRKLGGIGILHRGWKDCDEWEIAMKLVNVEELEFGISVGIDTNVGWLEHQLRVNKYLKIICVDTANGYRKELLEYLSFINVEFYNKPVIIMSGNVVTEEGVTNLAYQNCNMIRVGIGGGSLCTTRNTTGVGYPQMSALMECYEHAPYVIADGGIRYAGDMCKALTHADYVMLGGQLATTYESDNENGEVYGMASKRYQETVKGSHSSIEGITKKVERTNSLADFVEEWMDNLASSMSYVGAHNLSEFSRNARFVQTGTGSIDHSKMNGKPEKFVVEKLEE